MTEEEKAEIYQRFTGWMEVLNDALEEGRITTGQARSLLFDLAKKKEQPWA